MFLKNLSLQNFRSFNTKSFDFNLPITLIIGPNAIGKTSVVEAIFLLASGASFRANKVEEMIEFNNELSRVSGLVSNGNDEEDVQLDILLTRGLVQGKKTTHTLFSVNEIRRRKKDFVGKLLAVVFRPEDMRLVEGSPTRRRQFIDVVLCLMDREYAVSHKVYLEALKKRNKLLWQIKEGLMGKQVLSFWNLQLLKHGEILQKKRAELFRYFNRIVFSLNFSAEYKPSVISEKRLQQYEAKELLVGHTLIGPHKDDFLVNLEIENKKFDVGIYGSRGQQRLAVLWLKICELKFVEHLAKQRPILLLDDILSELDENNRSLVLDLVDKQQTIITSADSNIKTELIDFKFQTIKL